MTMTQDAARLHEMANEVAEITARIRPHIRSLDRIDPAFNAEGLIGGLVPALHRAGSALSELDRSLKQ